MCTYAILKKVLNPEYKHLTLISVCNKSQSLSYVMILRQISVQGEITIKKFFNCNQYINV